MAINPSSSHDAYYRRLTSNPMRLEFLHLQQIELHFMVPASIYWKTSFKSSRRYAVEYIERQTQGCGDAFIPYMAMTYFDRLEGKIECISREEGGGELPHLQQNFLYSLRRERDLFLLCCIIIAWKMRTRNFDLKNFMRERNLTYPAKLVLEMEYQICRRLKWRLRTLTAFSFVEYMIPILRELPGTPSPRRHVQQLIAKTKFDPAFLEYSPSILAAAAILTVSMIMYSEGHHIFEQQITNSEFFIRDSSMVTKCRSHIEMLFNPPRSTPTTAKRDSSEHLLGDPALQQEQQQPSSRLIDVDPASLEEEQEEEKEPLICRRPRAVTSSSEIQPEDPALQQEQQSIQDQLVDPAALENKQEEEQLIRRCSVLGKEPQVVASFSEIVTVLVPGSIGSINEPNDTLMDFDLGWIEAQEEADRLSGKGTLTNVLAAMLGEALENCCSSWRR